MTSLRVLYSIVALATSIAIADSSGDSFDSPDRPDGAPQEALAAEGYTTIGLAAPNPADKTEIITYIPGMTLLFDISKGSFPVRRQSDATQFRPYRKALTQDGIYVLVLDQNESIQRRMSNLKKFDFLVNRAMPVCRRLDECIVGQLWQDFDAKRRGGLGWYTVWARQGGKFVSRGSDSQFWKVQLLDNLEGWVERYIPARKGPRSIEDLGYITDLRRRHPLVRFGEFSGESLSTSCNESVKNLRVDHLLTEVKAFAKLGAGLAVEPQIPLPFAKQVLKFVGVEAEIKAEAEVSGEITFKTIDETETTVSYGAQGQSWQTKSVLIERYDDNAGSHFHYGNMLVKKVYECEGDTKTLMRNANFTVYLGDVGVPVDFENPLTPLNLNPAAVRDVIGLAPDPQFAALVSIKGQDDYETLMSYLLTQRGLPRAVSAFIVKEINLSPAFD